MKRIKIICSVLLTLFYSSVVVADNYVIINQVMYDTPLNEKTNSSPYCNGEFIELYNAGTNDISLSGWQLRGDGVSEKLIFSTVDSIKAGGYLIIACKRGTNNNFQLSDFYSLPDNYQIIYQNKIMLNNDGETITLYNATNDTIDQIYYDGESHKTNPYRLHAENSDSIVSGSQCLSLHRTWVEFDAEGRSITGTDQWQTANVTFETNLLPYDNYYEEYILGNQYLPDNENYVLSIEPLDPTTRIDIHEGQVSFSSGIRAKTTLVYFDGIGRQEQSVSLKASPESLDIVSTFEYCDRRNVSKQWLPIAIQTDGQRMAKEDLTAHAMSSYDDNRPFYEIQYEPSKQKRITKRYLPGESYSGHPAEKLYNINDGTENIRIYTVSNDGKLKTTGSNYSTGVLYKTTEMDEDGKSVTRYTDKTGFTIMEQRGNNRIYYVYDRLGQLRFTLPHSAQSKLTAGEYKLDNPILRASAYCYLYDTRGNMIYKRLPGCKFQLMIYDKAKQLIMEQNGNQRITNTWTIYAYDSIGRNLYTAEIDLEEDYEYYMNYFADKWYVEHYGNNPANTSIAGTGYASSVFPKSALTLLTINYYDDYDYLSRLSTPVRQKMRFAQESGYGLQHDNALGLLTGTRVYNLEEGGYTANAFYYDVKGQIVQSRSIRTNEEYRIITHKKYNFDGSVAQKTTISEKDSNIITEHYLTTYDHVGRAKEITYQLNNEEKILLSSFSYDETGHLVQNLLHNKRNTITYSYDMRNMLTESLNTHFSEKLYYADGVEQFANATPCFNGNVAMAQTLWTDTASLFSYSYDEQNRLQSSNRLTNSGSFFSEQYSYDEEGNVLALKRLNENNIIDSLVYYYGNEGNQLLSVTDNGHDADLHNLIEYHNSIIPVDTTMYYDANGNLIRDLDRGICAIHYNSLNFPDTIQYINGNQIVNLYDAGGHKYKSIVYTNLATAISPTYDIIHYSLDTDSIEYCITEIFGSSEIRSTPYDTIKRINNAIGYWEDSTYFYTVKDHLGNICVVVDADADSVVQRTMYYASGVPMAQSWGRDIQPYLYNSKEFVEAHGWNSYDYGFRNYYATIGRFTSIDPLAEQTPWQSPYVYAGNNFINRIDWMGLSATTTTEVNEIYAFWRYLARGGSVNGYNFDNGSWEDDTEKWDPYIKNILEEHKFFIVEVSSTGGGPQLEIYVTSTVHYDYNAISVDVGKYAQSVLEIGSTEVGTVGVMEVNPFFWMGKEGDIYNIAQRHGKGSYVYQRSYKLAAQRSAKSVLGRLGTGLSIGSAIVTGLEMYYNGVSTSNVIDLGVSAFGAIGGFTASPAILFGVTIYGAIDIGVSLGTGIPISDWIERGINYITDEYFY